MQAQNTPTSTDAALRQQVFLRCLALLAEGPPLLARTMVERLSLPGVDVDKRFVNTTLYRLGGDLVEHDPKSGKYSLLPRDGAPRPPAPEEVTMTSTDGRFCRGARVELLDTPPGRRMLRPGLLGEVMLGDEDDLPFGWLSVRFPGHARPLQLRRQHLQLVRSQPAPAEDKE